MEKDLHYGLVKEYEDSDLWYEPFTDTLDGFVLRSKDGVEIKDIYSKLER